MRDHVGGHMGWGGWARVDADGILHKVRQLLVLLLQIFRAGLRSRAAGLESVVWFSLQLGLGKQF